jgi:hypothetical protein
MVLDGDPCLAISTNSRSFTSNPYQMGASMYSSTASTVTHQGNGGPSIRTHYGSGSMKAEDLSIGDRVINITNYQPGQIIDINYHWGWFVVRYDRENNEKRYEFTFPLNFVVDLNRASVAVDGRTVQHTCEWCGKPATHCYREGRGTGHSEHVCACEDHQEE